MLLAVATENHFKSCPSLNQASSRRQLTCLQQALFSWLNRHSHFHLSLPPACTCWLLIFMLFPLDCLLLLIWMATPSQELSASCMWALDWPPHTQNRSGTSQCIIQRHKWTWVFLLHLFHPFLPPLSDLCKITHQLSWLPGEREGRWVTCSIAGQLSLPSMGEIKFLHQFRVEKTVFYGSRQPVQQL